MRYILAAAAAFFLLTVPAHAAIDHSAVQHFCGDRYCSIAPADARPRRAGSRRAKSSRKARVYQRRAAIKRPVTPPARIAVPGTLGAYRGEIAKPGPVADGLGNIRGLQSHFVAKLAALKAAAPAGLGGFNVGSGFRSRAEQARLHALKPGLAARPGRSQHEKGLAGDLRFASRAVSRWVHLNARKHGLRFPMRHEPWHIEPIGATRYAAKHRRYAAAR